MKVTMVAYTSFNEMDASQAISGAWVPEGSRASDLGEFAGRACYQSWKRPNPATVTNTGYLQHILDMQHFSVIEHGSVSFFIEEVSRSLTHELVRHRHFSFSQLSQRFVLPTEASVVMPPLFEGNKAAEDILSSAWGVVKEAYRMLLELAAAQLQDQGLEATEARKQAREAARCVLPNMTSTSLVMSGNHRSWREFIQKRATRQAEAEICRLAVEIFKQLKKWEPNIYQDMDTLTSYGRTVVIGGNG